jgi:penicillin-insensitive murein endopeptidase
VIRRFTTGLAMLAASLLPACVGAPTPLAPGLGGSVGVPHHGVVTNAVALPRRGPGFERLRDDDVKWGHPRLVGAIVRAAGEVARARPGGPPLVVADLGERFGGDTARHRSHESGRDVDILFYVTTPSGRAIENPGFIKFGADGLAPLPKKKTFARLDVDRSWLLVRALLQATEGDVQWIFVSRPVESLLVEHARAIGEPDELVWRAEVVLAQPSDSTPHDDHFHVRIACTPEETVAGCEGGPRRPWQPELPSLAASDRELLEALLE